MVYAVWEMARLGGRWVVPAPVLAVEYGVALASVVVLLWWTRRAGRTVQPS